MSNRRLLWFAFAALLALVLRSSSAQATVTNAAAARQSDEREVLSYFTTPRPAAVEWAFLQDRSPRDERRRGPGGQRGGPRGPARGFNSASPDGDGRPPFPPLLLERLRAMTPQQRERVLQNNPRFRDLPPERKAQLLERLNTLLEMNDDQRRELDQRLSVFRNLSIEQRRKARQIYENHWRTLPPNRRNAVLEEFRNLREMSNEERSRRVTSDEYQNQFSAEERALLNELSSL